MNMLLEGGGGPDVLGLGNNRRATGPPPTTSSGFLDSVAFSFLLFDGQLLSWALGLFVLITLRILASNNTCVFS